MVTTPSAMPRRATRLTATPPLEKRRPLAAVPESEPEADPQLSYSYWNHGCPAPGCTTVLPRHLPACTHHRRQ